MSRFSIALVGAHEPSPASTGYGDVWGDGKLACLGVWTAYSTSEFGSYDISSPATPNLLMIYKYGIGGGSETSGGSGRHIVSLANLSPPVVLTRITKGFAGTVMNGFNNVHTLFLERNFLYEAERQPT